MKILRHLKEKNLNTTPRNGKLTPFSLTGRINIVKMTSLPRAIHRFIAKSIKAPMAFFQVNKHYGNSYGIIKDYT